MSNDHEPKPRRRVAEAAPAVPVQVFLGARDHALLQRLTDQLDASKSEVLRRSLAALERQMLNPDVHPTLRLIGIVDGDTGVDDGIDAAIDHDHILSAAHDYPRAPRGRKRRGKS